ncbi:MAG: ABC transporter substrate-binding protein [Acetobacteraceae bacterium]
MSRPGAGRRGSGAGTLTRRRLIKGSAALAGAAVGSGAVTGFPTIWAQNLKDITLRHVGMSYSTLKPIAEQAQKDLGFKVAMTVVDYPGMTNRLVNEPKSMDIADTEIWQTKIAVARGATQAVEIKRVKNWDQLTPLYTKGIFDGKEVSRIGDSPIKMMYRESRDARTFAGKTTDWGSFVPSVFNADTLGIRPDLVGRPIHTWADLISHDFRGRAAIQNIPTNGGMDAMMALQAAGVMKFGNMGDPTKAEIAGMVDQLIRLKKAGHWRALWNTFEESVNLMASGEVVIQSMWSPAVTAVKAMGVDCVYQPLKEGYRGWGNGLSFMRHLNGLKLDAAYEYATWYNTGWVGAFIAKQGYYSANPATAEKYLTPNQWGFFYEGKPATAAIHSPEGRETNSVGQVRDGGSFIDRFSHVAIWNTLPTNAEYLYAKWNEFVSAA